MKNSQATFCRPLKFCQKWARFIRNVKLCKFFENTTRAKISILLKKVTIFAYGECRKNFNDTVHFLVEYYPKVGFTKCKIKRVVNLFEDTESVRELNYLAKIS
jgi:hypothetical protein